MMPKTLAGSTLEPALGAKLARRRDDMDLPDLQRCIRRIQMGKNDLHHRPFAGLGHLSPFRKPGEFVGNLPYGQAAKGDIDGRGMGRERRRNLGGGLPAEEHAGGRNPCGELREVISAVGTDLPFQPAEREFAAAAQARVVVGRRQVLHRDRHLGPPPAAFHEGHQKVHERRRPARSARERAEVSAQLQDQIAVEILEAACEVEPAQAEALGLELGKSEGGAAVPQAVVALDQFVRYGKGPERHRLHRLRPLALQEPQIRHSDDKRGRDFQI